MEKIIMEIKVFDMDSKLHGWIGNLLLYAYKYS